MAQKYITQLVDDLTGEVIESGSGETISFSIGTASYLIDLTTEHAAQFRAAMATYVDAARRYSATAKAVPSRPAATGVDVKAIRAWAESAGLRVSGRGRIPAEIREAYAAAH